MPILGIVAAAGGFTKFGDFYQIATSTASTGAVADFTFSNIPQDYTHLQIRGIVRTNRADSNQDALRIRFNSDSGNNYAHHFLLGNGSSASSGANTSISGILIDGVTVTNSAANSFGAFVIDLLDYKNTNKNKTLRSLSGREDNTSGSAWFESGVWLNTSAITTVTIIPVTGSSFVQYSSFALYGIKAS